MTRYNSTVLPKQRLSYNKKNKKWRKDNLDYADKYSFYHNESVRQTLKNKILNLNLYNGKVDVRDMTSVVNPYGIDADFVPNNIPHHPIIIPKIDLLIGEESKRRFDWSVIVTNPNAVSKKEEDKKKFLTEKISAFLKQNYEQEELEQKIDELEKFIKYEWQDVREKMGSQIMKHYWEEEEFQLKFTKGFKDALIMSEEIYQVDIEFNEPVLNKLNPLKVHSVRSGNSDKIEDSSIIIIEDHWSPSRIIDLFHEELKGKDIDQLQEYSTVNGKGSYNDDDTNHVLLTDGLETDIIEDYITLAEVNGHNFNSNYIDENGNIRILRVYWKSLKKIKKIKFYDEFGETQHKIVSEEYIIDKDRGEEEKLIWVNEWWEGTKVGKDIYLQMKPRKIQYNKINNPSYCHPGIIGQVYNTNQGKAVSLMDRAKNYQYLYDAIWDRLNKAISSNYGKLFELDIAKVPENWEVEKWLHFAVVNKIAVVNSFKEGNKGASTGKLAGGMNTVGGRVIDMETGSYIQQHIQLLEYIKMEMGEIVGVSEQRQGQIQNRETVGGIERSVAQSSHITEYWFMQHEKLKLRIMNAFIETAKIALKGKNKKVQYILDDQTIQMLNIDGDAFAESDYGIMVTSSSKTIELENALKQYSQAFLQNGGRMSTIMDIYFSPSLSDMRRKLEIAEDDIMQQKNKSAEEQNKLNKEQMEKQASLEQSKLELDNLINLRNNETKLKIASLNKESNNEELEDDIVSEREKFENDKVKEREDLLLKIKTLDNDMLKHKDNLSIKKEQVNNQKQKSKNTN